MYILHQVGIMFANVSKQVDSNGHSKNIVYTQRDWSLNLVKVGNFKLI